MSIFTSEVSYIRNNLNSKNRDPRYNSWTQEGFKVQRTNISDRIFKITKNLHFFFTSLCKLFQLKR